MRVRVLALGAGLTVAMACGIAAQIRVERDLLTAAAATERTLRADLQHRQERGLRAVSRLALAADEGELAAAEAGVAGSEAGTEALAQAVREGIDWRERNDAAYGALLAEIASIRFNGSRLVSTSDYARLAKALTRIRLAAAAAPPPRTAGKQRETARALSSAQVTLIQTIRTETLPIRALEQKEARAALRIGMFSLLLLAAGMVGMGALLLLWHTLAGRYEREVGICKTALKLSSAKTRRVVEHALQAAAAIRKVSGRLGKQAATNAGQAPVLRTALRSGPSRVFLQLPEGVANTMQALRQTSVEIGTATEQIRAIAFRTNILALNAAIEAAHAGDRGAGFGIVAAEVKSLAAESSVCTGEIEVRLKAMESRIAELGSMFTQLGESANRAEIVPIDASPKVTEQRCPGSETGELNRVATDLEQVGGGIGPRVLQPLRHLRRNIK